MALGKAADCSIRVFDLAEQILVQYDISTFQKVFLHLVNYICVDKTIQDSMG